jgi:hypothetical protein
MSGFNFVTDERGRKKAVIIDLKKHGRLWEDFYDKFLCESRKKGPFESHEAVGRRLKARRAHA